MKIRKQRSIKSATDTAGICAVPEVLGAADDFDLDSWVKTLIARSEPTLRKHFDAIDWDYNDKTLWAYATKELGNGERTLIDFEIPLEDFSWNYAKMNDDVSYLIKGLTDQVAEAESDKPVESAVEADDDPIYEPDEGLYWEDDEPQELVSFTMLKTKSVLDSDGFWTDYSLYEVEEDGEIKYECIFGDNELYDPSNSEPDVEFDAIEPAEEWFDNYEGFADDEVEDVDSDDYLNDHW